MTLAAPAQATADGDVDLRTSSNHARQQVEDPDQLAQADEPEDRASRSQGLEPRYLPREPEEKSGYNSDYIFGITRSVADSTISPAGKGPLYILTVPLDLAFLPFTLIGGMFG